MTTPIPREPSSTRMPPKTTTRAGAAGAGGGAHRRPRRGRGGGGPPPGLHVGAPVVGVHLVEAADVLLLPRQALHHADAGDVLLQVGVDDRYRLADADEGAAGAALPDSHGDDEHRYDGEGDERQLNVQVEQEEDYQAKPREIGQDGEEAGGEELLEDGDVVLDAGHHAADLRAVQEAEGELLEVIEHPGAEGEQHAVADEGGG